MTEEQRAAVRRQIDGLELKVEVLRHYVNIWPGANVSRERARAERLGFETQMAKIKNMVASIELSIRNMLPMVERERPEDCDCSDAYEDECP